MPGDHVSDGYQTMRTNPDFHLAQTALRVELERRGWNRIENVSFFPQNFEGWVWVSVHLILWALLSAAIAALLLGYTSRPHGDELLWGASMSWCLTAVVSVIVWVRSSRIVGTDIYAHPFGNFSKGTLYVLLAGLGWLGVWCICRIPDLLLIWASGFARLLTLH